MVDTNRGSLRQSNIFSVPKLYDGSHTELVKHINLALRAHLLFENGKDYVVRDGEVVLLDDKDGRILEMTKLQGGNIKL